MKKITLTCIGIFIASLCFSQTAIKKNSSTNIKPGGTIKSENNLAIKEKPQRILTPEEIRKKNVTDLLYIMLDFSNMISSDYKEAYDLILNKSSYLEYRPETNTSAVVLIKNSMNHTLNKIDVSFDSLRVKRMVQYSLVKNNRSENDHNAKWSNEMVYSFVFEYDSVRLTTIRKAYNGWEDVPHQVVKYFVSYNNGHLDSIVYKDAASRKRAIAYYNEKVRVDSIYFYSYQLPKGTVFFLNKQLYLAKNNNEIQKELLEKYAGINREKAICDSSHLILDEKRIENPLLHYIEVTINQYKYDTNGLLSSSEQRSIDTKKVDELTDSLRVKGYPYRSTYFYNGNNQVIKRIITYNDGCIESEEVINYTIDNFGFVTQTTSKKVVKNNCIY